MNERAESVMVNRRKEKLYWLISHVIGTQQHELHLTNPMFDFDKLLNLMHSTNAGYSDCRS